MPRLNSQINPRGWSRADMGIEHLNDHQLSQLNTTFEEDLLEHLGIPVSDEGTIPKNNGVPRLFAITVNENGEEKINDLSESPLPKSPEFWRQVQLGNVFAYPAGQADPVQVQINTDSSKRPSLQYSKSVTSRELPAPPAKPLGFWKRAAWILTFGNAFDKQRREYNQRIQNAENTRNTLNEFNVKRNAGVQGEVQQAEERKAVMAERKRIAVARSNAKSAQNYAEENDIGIKHVTDIFGPVPKYDTSLDRERKENRKYGLYNKTEFNNLTKFNELNLDSIQLGSGGQSVTEEEFAAVGFFTVCDPKHARKVSLMQHGDKYVEQSLRELGFPEKDIPRLVSAQAANFVAHDLFIIPPRSGEGAFFKDATNPARKETRDAFIEYQKGNKEQLAGLIAKGINYAAEDVAAMDTAKMSTQTRAAFVMSGKLLDLMEKDPELKDLALEKGMDKHRLKSVEGAKVIMRLAQDARNAEKTFAENAAEGNELSKQQKKNLLQTILKDRIVCTKLAAENTATNEDSRLKKEMILVNQRFAEINVLAEYKADHSKRPAPGTGKIWNDSAVPVMSAVDMVYNHQPQTAQNMTDALEVNKIERVADEIINKYNLTELSVEELANKFGYRDNEGIKLTGEIAAAEQKLFAPQHGNLFAHNENVIVNDPVSISNEGQVIHP